MVVVTRQAMLEQDDERAYFSGQMNFRYKHVTSQTFYIFSQDRRRLDVTAMR